MQNAECLPAKCQRPIYLKTYEEMFFVTGHRDCKLFAVPGRDVQRTDKSEVKLKAWNYDMSVLLSESMATPNCVFYFK
jgi:hypothetical protein